MDNPYVTVSKLNEYIYRKFSKDRDLRNVYVKGEISNFKTYPSGHCYFTLKDEDSRISGVMFRNYARLLKFEPKNGMKVLIRGEISVYDVKGTYKIAAHKISPDGLGDLHLAFEQLKKKLKKDETLLTQYCTAIPIGTALAQSWNIEYAQLCGDIVGKEMEQHGVDFWLAPGMNIHRNVLCGRNFEYFSEDPLLAGLIASGITKGVQSHKNKFVTLKHFACNNQEMNRFYNNSVVDERTLREIYLKPFEITIKEANAMSVMSSYNLVNGKHTNESVELINDYLRNEANFKGIVMTDWIMTTTPPVNGSVYPATDVTKVIKANTQLFMPGSGNHFKQALASVKSGDISRYELERAVSPFLELIQNLK